MTVNKFWTSEQRLLTMYWKKHFSLTSRQEGYPAFTGTGPDPRLLREEKMQDKGPQIGQPSRIRRRMSKLPLPSSLLANVQSLENKIDDLRLRLSYQRKLKKCNSLCSTETWLNDGMDNIELGGFSMHRQNRDATSGKTRGERVCLFVNNSWCALRYC